MIFVTVGTQKFQLNRLLRLIDECVLKQNITDTVIAQTGGSDYIPQNYEYQKFFDKQQFQQMLETADMIIAHSGVGTIISALRLDKPVIVFPRLFKYNEHVDDHQVEIAKAFEKKGYALCCYEDSNLIELIETSRTHPAVKYDQQEGKITDIIEQYITKHMV